MNLKALITTLILGSSSLAMAQPVTFSAGAKVTVGFNSGYESRPVVVDHRRLPPVPAPAPVADPCAPAPIAQPLPVVPVRPVYFNPDNTTVAATSSTYIGSKPFMTQYRDGRHWVALTEPTRIDSGREFINFGTDGARFSQIKLFNNRGSSHIQQIAIEFVGGGTQKVVLNQMLTSSNPITIDLTGGFRPINRIIVYGSTNFGSSYQILAH
jgi:hypothetical protein